MTHILLVEDDMALSRGIALALQNETIEVNQCRNLSEARKILAKGLHEMLILDINLPDGSGLDFCCEIRNSVSIPILFLTANDTEMDIVIGLEAGGDDYITKPFSLAVLRARVNALLRRGLTRDLGVKYIDEFCFDFDNMNFSKGEERIELSKTEQKLLHLLINNKGITLSRETLLRKIWPDGSEYVDENALSVAVRRLRAKLESDPSNPSYIKTVHGIGYVWMVMP